MVSPGNSGPGAYPSYPAVASLDCVELLGMDDAAFRARFRGTVFFRVKRSGMLRNAAIVLGNHGDSSATAVLIEALQDASPLVRGAAAWSLGKLGGQDSRGALVQRRQAEGDEQVRIEISAAISQIDVPVVPRSTSESAEVSQFDEGPGMARPESAKGVE